ncbi:MAG: hypothetical protein JKY71_03080 [Alphaproteobacteria bacterium]|nr:hypothetical protein [Alphaproteobacteria bacterium]
MKSRRVITFVPTEHAEKFATDMASHIPKLFGNYDSVCWWSDPKTESGTEQFRPDNGEIRQAPSVRMEFSIPDDDSAYERFSSKLKELHPWDQPVILCASMDIEDNL